MYPQPMQPSPTVGWKVLQSWWVLVSLLGCGCLSGAGFVLIGLRARKPWWWASGLAYMAIGSALFIYVGKLPSEDDVGGGLAVLWLLLWFGSVVHSFVLNFSWLRWQEEHRPAPQVLYTPVPAQPFYGAQGPYGMPTSGGAGYGAPTSGVPASGLPASGVPWPVPSPWSPNPVPPGSHADYTTGYRPEFVAARPVDPPQQYTFDSPVSAPFSQAVDVNNATGAQLAAAAGIDHARVSYLLVERDRRGGFSTVEEFTALAQLTPQHAAAVRPLLFCGPYRRTSGF